MCAVSNVGDYWHGTLPDRPYWPAIHPIVTDPAPIVIKQPPEITRQEFEALKRDMEELKKLLAAAVKYDAATGQPHCETESKIALIKKLAELVGVDMSDVFGK